MKSLIVEGKNDSLSTTQRKSVFIEIDELNTEINKVAIRTTFNGNSLLSSTGVISATGTASIGSSAGTNAQIASLSFTNTTAATYTLTTTATTLTLTNGTTSVAQTLTTVAAGAAGTQTLDFNQFGIKIGLLHSDASTAAQIGTGLSTKTLIVANAGPAAMGFQSGASKNDLFNFQTLNVQTDANAVAGSTGAALSTARTLLSNATTTALYNTAFDSINTAVDNVIDSINTQRATLGAQMNRVSYISNQLIAQSSNLQQSRSAVIDTDFAAETALLTKGQIMQQAATAMLAQANQMPNVILSLLK
jgi:flagellin